MSSSKEDSIDAEFVDINDNEWIDVLENGDLLRRVISKPEVDNADKDGEPRKPQNGEKVKIKVSGRFDDNNRKNRINIVNSDEEESILEIDKHDELEFTIGLCDVIQAFELTVPFMVVGEIDEIRTSSRFAYGEYGREPDIPPNTSLYYKIELLSIEPGDDVDSMNLEQRIQYSTLRKERGNYYYKRCEYSQSIHLYEKAISALEHDRTTVEDRKTLNPILAALYNNLTAAQLKICAWEAAMDSANRCLRLEPKNAKCLYRQSKAYLGLCDYENAVKNFEQVKKLGYDVKGMNQEIEGAKRAAQKERDKMKMLYRNMAKGISPEAEDGSDSDSLFGLRKKTLIRRFGYSVMASAVALGAIAAYRFALRHFSQT